MKPLADAYDVLVIGGGPAGATAATLVAERGHRVLLAERSTEPQFKIGESLMPATYWTLSRLGMLEKMKASAFPRKYSVQFYSKTGRPSKPFYFFENDPQECSQTWQVLRSRFDEMLLDNAMEKGVEVRRGLAVARVLFEDGRAVGAEVQSGDGAARRIGARVVVDATGQSALLARHLDLLQVEPRMRHISYLLPFPGRAARPRHRRGRDAGDQHDHREVVVLVHPAARRRGERRSGGPDRLPGKGARRRPCGDLRRGAGPRRAGAAAHRRRRAALPDPRSPATYSYRARQIAGDGWVLVGDAFGFIDPIYSTGVLLALKSGEMAADAINDGLAGGDLSGPQLGRFGVEFTDGMEALRRLVYTYYAEGFSFAKFLRAHPHCRRDIVMLLTGNVYRERVGDLFERLGEMIELPAAPPFDPPVAAAGAATRT